MVVAAQRRAVLAVAGAVVLVHVEDDGCGGVAVPPWAAKALGLDQGTWERGVIDRAGRTVVEFRPVTESGAGTGAGAGPPVLGAVPGAGRPSARKRRSGARWPLGPGRGPVA